MGVEKIRLLKAREIDCRVGTCKKNGFSLLLYKNARVDMDLLDEKYGVDGWQREHREIKGHLFCCVSIWSGSRWIVKEDVGTESNAESTKGEASDSFKRACVNVGIGRELYTAPFIWVNAWQKNNNSVIIERGNKFSTYEKLSVSEIKYNEDREINHLVIVDSDNRERYRFVDYSNVPIEQSKPISGQPDPFKEPKEKSLKEQTKELSLIEKFKKNIIEMGKNPVLKEFEKTEFRGKFKTATTLESLKNLSVEMELAIQTKGRK